MMDGGLTTFVLGLSTASLLLLLAYRWAWIARRGHSITPTGAGLFLGVALLLAAVIFDAPRDMLIALVVVLLATVVYWIDDLVELSARLRLALSFLTGAMICAALGFEGSMSMALLAVACVLSGVLNVVLTNVVNFYDGADLNLATFIALTAAFILVFEPAQSLLCVLALAALAFIFPFALLNSRPRTIYLGDAGSFAFACFLTTIAILYFRHGDMRAEVAIPLALPVLDTFYVFCIRVIEKHDLMTRNYLHLYQRLNGRFFRFCYLLPQLINAGLVLAAARYLQSAGWSNLAAVAVSGIVVTLVFYLACRRYLLPPREKGSVG